MDVTSNSPSPPIHENPTLLSYLMASPKKLKNLADDFTKRTSNSPSPVLHEKPTLLSHLMASPTKLKNLAVDFTKRTRKIGEDDPRRIIHAFKVALAITLASLAFYLNPLYNIGGDNNIWAVMTVVVVFEFRVGATIGKGLNRGLATLLAGALGVGTEYLAKKFGEKAEPFVLGSLVFVLAAAATFSRFFPVMKKRHDYGAMIFILTFSLVAVSGYRVTDILIMAQQRLSAILIGGAACVIVSLCVCPVWAGTDLHDLIVDNLEKLSIFLEGFGGEYYQLSKKNHPLVQSGSVGEDDKSFLDAYKSVLNSKATEESLANFAWWEVRLGKFRFRHPWKQYLKIGVVTRQCAYHIEILNGFINPKLQASSEFKKMFQEPCIKMSSEAGKALKELALSIKSTSFPSASAYHIQKCKAAMEELNARVQASMVGKWDVLEMLPVMTFASILIDIIKSIEQISEAIEELANQAHFKKPIQTPKEIQKPRFLAIKSIWIGDDKGFVTITVQDLERGWPEKRFSGTKARG